MDKKLLNACMGKSASSGGLNLPKFKIALQKQYPQRSKEIGKKTRKSLYGYCLNSPEIKQDIRNAKEKYFVTRSPLSQQQKKYCRCIAHVAAKNPEWCNKHGTWKTCVNPYAVCTTRTRRTGMFYCVKYMDLDSMPAKEVKALADMKGISIPELKEKSDFQKK
uniref:HeH/LEM domain protein n=1 Tax=Marseillevirus LCMAC102 TaxID=2506603 RepID=A0A481YUX7_9VIRU|nr:MAG: HeH/LEM domain protein [Marseillevirus LCMAC102]